MFALAVVLVLTPLNPAPTQEAEAAIVVVEAPEEVPAVSTPLQDGQVCIGCTQPDGSIAFDAGGQVGFLPPHIEPVLPPPPPPVEDYHAGLVSDLCAAKAVFCED